ncbi:MAG: 30S ribosomal protein S20 [Ignavibacteriales bacterium]|nr:MAG: 30S ribosomal protein S20 [Ignavibacteriaceae bacterium]MBW7874287.1 30S ribosomal protein S20 [Ignavibacteria bacterium]MCZ2142669.1 30S ribosomal protein S20 [Ignavibacteriales bacterium]OQY71021.1 MAG: 30S ribosomal protein S20 [Ignavibacteriales bacterium UTCHB3]MBV6443767.1 30S ribosomal protein S20 [Ignavibacteriaceae bacterium]
MANHKSAEKRIRQSARRREINKASISKMKTLVKKVLASTNIDEATPAYKEAVAHLDRIAVKGRVHRNNAARKKSRLTLHLNSLAK